MSNPTEPAAFITQSGDRIDTAVTRQPSPIAVAIQVAADSTLTVGLQGPQGPPGSGGGGAGNTFIQHSAPSSPPATYAWLQTLLGNSGHDITLWVEDGT